MEIQPCDYSDNRTILVLVKCVDDVVKKRSYCASFIHTVDYMALDGAARRVVFIWLGYKILDCFLQF